MNDDVFDNLMFLYKDETTDMKITLFYFMAIRKFPECVNKGTLKHEQTAKKYNYLLNNNRWDFERLLNRCRDCRDNFTHDLQSGDDYSIYTYYDNGIAITKNTLDSIAIITSNWIKNK